MFTLLFKPISPLHVGGVVDVRTSDLRLLQFIKQLYPMVVIVLGNVIVFMFEKL